MVVKTWTFTLKEMGSHRRILDRGVLYNLHLERCIYKRINGMKARKLVAVRRVDSSQIYKALHDVLLLDQV